MSEKRDDSCPRFEGVFLDFYGTLASGDVQAVEAVCAEVIGDFGLKMTACEMAKLWGHRYFAAIEGCLGDCSTSLADNADRASAALGNGHFRNLKQIERDTLIETISPWCGSVNVDKYIVDFNAYLARPTLYEEVREVLAALHVPVCIVSNADDEELLAAIEHHGLRFEYVVSSETSSSYKPVAKIFRTALEMTGWAAERVLHVGDSLHSDVGGAHGVGIKAAWINRCVRISDIGTDVPDYAWTDLRPLVDLIEGSGRRSAGSVGQMPFRLTSSQ